MMLALAAAAAGVLAFILPSLYDEVLSFSASLPDLLSAGLIRGAAFADAQGFDFPVGKELADMVHSSLGQLAPGAYLAKQLFSGAGSVLITALNLVVLPFLLLFHPARLAADQALRFWARAAAPPRLGGR